MILLGLLELALVAQAQENPCASAPTEAAKIMCHQLYKADEAARVQASKRKNALPPLLRENAAAERHKAFAAREGHSASSLYQCMDLPCLCPYLKGHLAPNGDCTLPNKQLLKKAVRKELRMLSDDELQRYHAAVQTLKNNGEYDRISRIHEHSTVVGGAHSGPAFLPWHRELIKRFELALRQVDPSLSLPYWDSTLEAALDRRADSALFSAEMEGGTDAQGMVNSGPYVNFRTLEGRPNIKRAVGAQGVPMAQAYIDFVMRQSQVDQVLAFSAPRQGCPYRTHYNNLEYTHGYVHLFVGGDMFEISTAANDPIFFPHHCFIDFIWEQWRQQRQTRADRETLYPPDNELCSSPQHFAAASMNPFLPMSNIDGLSNNYTDNLYEYAARPFCSEALPNCGSKYLFCDLSAGQPRCAPKMKRGAACSKYVRGEAPCLNGYCQAGRCVAVSGQVVTPTPPPPVSSAPITSAPQSAQVLTPTPPPLAHSAPIIAAPQETCFNENQCCAPWAASGECTRNVGYMSERCKASCGYCRPQYRLVDDCSDRHAYCLGWSLQGECAKNVLWMTENCRKSCGKCSQSRAQACGGGGAVATTVRQCSHSYGCFNANACCPHWSLFGKCSKSPTYMTCDCSVSCGYCIPTYYSYGSCVDYHRSCAEWAHQGECEKNPWMAENCRASCRTCYPQWDLRSMCRGAVGSVRPVATNRPQTNVIQAPQWQQGSMGSGNIGGGGGRGNGWGGQMSNWGRSTPNWGQLRWWLRRQRD